MVSLCTDAMLPIASAAGSAKVLPCAGDHNHSVRAFPYIIALQVSLIHQLAPFVRLDITKCCFSFSA